MDISTFTGFFNRMTDTISPYCSYAWETGGHIAAQASSFFATICSNLWDSSASSSSAQACSSLSAFTADSVEYLGGKVSVITDLFQSTFFNK